VEEVKGCDILLLPYDVNIFKYRNSAFAFMGLYFGKYVASYRGSSMHDSASKLGLDVDLLDIQNSIGQINHNSRLDVGLSSEYVSEKWYSFLE
jgi:hypothetical protein